MTTIEDSTETDTEAREAAVALLAEGEATLSEAARLAGVDRQLVYYWAKRAGIDPAKTRDAKLAKAWRKKIKKRR